MAARKLEKWEVTSLTRLEASWPMTDHWSSLEAQLPCLWALDDPGLFRD